VVADSRAKRDGRFIERLGSYNPLTNPATIELDTDKALDWVLKGAQPSDTVRAILSYKGVLMRKHLQVGVHKGAITQEQADNRFAEWLESSVSRIQNKIEGLKASADEHTRVRMEREVAVATRRAESLRAAQAAAEAPAETAEGGVEAADNSGETTAEEA
jgi:small subunit ribosomal protein S16